MHRHGYKGRKFGRETDQRRALINSLAEALIEHGSIDTTLHKAKELVPYMERLITKAKKGDLHNRRQIISALQTTYNANKLVDEIAPKLKGRNSGHLRIEKLGFRRGDHASLAKVSFVEQISGMETPIKKAVAAKTADEKTQKTEKRGPSTTITKIAPKKVATKTVTGKQAPSHRRTGSK